MTDRNQCSVELPLVSVIVASFNHAPYIKACIESIMAQTYPSIELLVVDDGSTDGSVELITQLQQQYRFNFRVQANQGLSRTLNTAIESANGSLIAPFGSDDVMLPERLAVQVRYLQDKPEVGICAGAIREIDASGQLRGSAQCYGVRRLNFDDVFQGLKRGAPAPTLLFRREALERVGGFDPDIRLEDLLIELKITRAGYFIDVLDDVLAYYRIHESNTHKNYRFMKENVLRIYALFHDDPAYESVRCQYLNSMLLKCARADRVLAKELLAELPLSAWGAKTLRALLRMLTPR